MIRLGLREGAFVLLLLAMPLAAWMLVFQPRAEAMAQARVEITQKQAKLEQLGQATAVIDDLGGEIDKLTAAIELFEQKLPAQREVEVILKEVWELAAEHDLTPKSIRTDKIVPAAGYAELPIKMVIVGDFDGFYSFLRELGELPRITQVPSMKLKKLDGQEGHMQAEMVLSIFFEAQEGKQ